MRLLHTMLRVGDLQRSIDFYTNVLGMKLLRTSENPEYKYSLAFVGYGPETDEAVIELTYNWGVDSYELGTAYGHIALEVDNAAEACERIRSNGGNVTREAGPVHSPIGDILGPHVSAVSLFFGDLSCALETTYLRPRRVRTSTQSASRSNTSVPRM